MLEVTKEYRLGLRCVVADRSAIFALGLKATLEPDNVTVVGCVDEPSDVAEFLGREPADVVLSCFEPPLDAISVARKVEGCSVLILSSLVADDVLIEAVRAGARGVLAKDASKGELLAAIRRVARGETVLPPGWERTLARMIELNDRRREAREWLSTREEEVIRLVVVRGYSNKQIARELGIAEQTVKNHVRHIMAKLGLSSRVQLCRWALDSATRFRLDPSRDAEPPEDSAPR